MRNRLLVVDDDREILEVLTTFFADFDIETLTATDGSEALRTIREARPHAALLDVNLAGESGLALLKEIKKLDSSIAVIIATGYSTAQNAIEAMRLGAYEYVTKPFDLDKVHEIVFSAFACNALNRRVSYARTTAVPPDEKEEVDIMIGSSPEMTEIWKMVGKVADSDATILIQGESGTGKELLAKAIYSNSCRRDKPFLAVNCAALPEHLLESELFGHERGAFTDAVVRRIGKFEQCDGGTLFLDEVGEMSPASQGKLLRILENQEFQRVGGNATIKVDVRIIAATNRSLVTAVKEKQFRMDLFYRLRVVSFFLPPLRERKEDIPLLTDLFLRNSSRRYGKRVTGISPEALELLMVQPWEGNIRELKNTIDSSVVFSKSDLLTPADFATLQHLPCEPVKAAAAAVREGDLAASFTGLLQPDFDRLCTRNPRTLYDSAHAALDKALIALTLEKVGGNQVTAAKLLGVSRNTLRDRIEKHLGKRGVQEEQAAGDAGDTAPGERASAS